MNLLSGFKIPEINRGTLSGDLVDTLYSKTREVCKSIYEQKTILLNTHLDIKKITDWSFVKETSSDWAKDRIIQFQRDNEITTCEIISVNDIVFVFGKIKMEETGSEFPQAEITSSTNEIEGVLKMPSRYVYKVSLPYAVFKK